MITHFFSTSAGFWEKVAIVVTLFWIPELGSPRRFLLLGLTNPKARQKRKQPERAAFWRGV
jgi:hypothetical protein